MDIVVYVDENRMLRSDCTDVHTDLDFVRKMHKAIFSCVAHQIKSL